MSQTLRLAFYQILKPLMQILYRKGIALGDFTAIVKQAYVDVVEQQLSNHQKRVTTTRIAAITGLTRKEVAQLRSDANFFSQTHRFSRSERLVNAWVKDPEFLDNIGEPALLPFRGERGSFEALVYRYSGDMSCFAMREEMKRIELIREREGQYLQLLNKAYIPHGDEEEKLGLMGVDVSSLIATIDHNITVTDPRALFFQRKVSYDDLPSDVLPAFRLFVEQDSQQLLVRFNDWLQRHDGCPDFNAEYPRMRAGVGIYYFQQLSNNKNVSSSP